MVIWNKNCNSFVQTSESRQSFGPRNPSLPLNLCPHNVDKIVLSVTDTKELGKLMKKMPVKCFEFLE